MFKMHLRVQHAYHKYYAYCKHVLQILFCILQLPVTSYTCTLYHFIMVYMRSIQQHMYCRNVNMHRVSSQSALMYWYILYYFKCYSLGSRPSLCGHFDCAWLEITPGIILYWSELRSLQPSYTYMQGVVVH